MALAVLSTLTLLGGLLDFPDILGNYGMWAGSGAYAWRCSNMVGRSGSSRAGGRAVPKPRVCCYAYVRSDAH